MKNLESIGWNSYYEDNITDKDKKNFDIARVIAEHRKFFVIKTSDKEYRAIVSGNFFHNTMTKSDMPVVGDWVMIKKDTFDPAIIQKIITRKTALTRRLPADRKASAGSKEQVIGSNIDTVFIVTSLNQNFNLSRIERALALVYSSGATPVILLSKSDLCDAADKKIELVKEVAFEVKIISFSNITMIGIDEIKSLFKPGKTFCLIGSSGVGKTSLMNILCDKSEKTAEIRAKDDTGRHATTARSLYFLENGGMLIDTPGIREIGLINSDTDTVESFDDIDELATNCKFNDCSHGNEPGCAVNAAIANGELDSRRFNNYLKMKTENKFQNDKEIAMRNKNVKFKKISKMIKQIKK